METRETELGKQRLIAKTWYVSILGLATLFGLAGGVLGASIFAARAESSSKMHATAEIIIPHTGLLFKTAEGKTIAKLIGGNSGTSFQIFNPGEQKVANLQSYMGGGSLTLWNDENNSGLDMFANRDGGIFTIIDTRKGKNVILMAPADDGGTILINDGHGDSVVKLGVDRKGGKLETFASEIK